MILISDKQLPKICYIERQFRGKLHKFSFCVTESYQPLQGSQHDLRLTNTSKENFHSSLSRLLTPSSVAKHICLSVLRICLLLHRKINLNSHGVNSLLRVVVFKNSLSPLFRLLFSCDKETLSSPVEDSSVIWF